MPDNDTLMAFLVPKYTDRLEDAATDALAHILNKCGGAMRALNELLREGGFGIEGIARVRTQVTYDDGSRPDMAGYDKDGVTRLLVESKFWASLMEDQASRYAKYMDQPGPSVLMFIAPELRRKTLWAEIGRQMSELGELDPVMPSQAGVERAGLVWKEPRETELHILLTSWDLLLEKMDDQSGDTDVRSDIRQLRGLTQMQDEDAFLPLHSGDLSPERGRRVLNFIRIVDDTVLGVGVAEGWMNVEGMAAAAHKWGYGRWFKFSGSDAAFSFGVNHRLWAKRGDTPLWLGLYYDHWDNVNMDAIGRELGVEVVEVDSFRWVPVRLKTGVEYDDVLDDVAAQLRRIDRIVSEGLGAESPSP